MKLDDCTLSWHTVLQTAQQQRSYLQLLQRRRPPIPHQVYLYKQEEYLRTMLRYLQLRAQAVGPSEEVTELYDSIKSQHQHVAAKIRQLEDNRRNGGWDS